MQEMQLDREELQYQVRRSVSSVVCKYDDGVLVLRGRLNSFFHTQLAQETVRRIEGVKRVVNQIEVVSRAI
jgi:osmotically-inducible protein OsmY